MTTYTTLLFDINNNIARITLNRPDAANGMDMTMGRELMDVALRCDQDTSIRAIILTGSGNFFFRWRRLKSIRQLWRYDK